MRTARSLKILPIALVLLLALMQFGVAQGQPPSQSQAVAIAGVTHVDGEDVIVEVLVAVNAGENASEKASRALRSVAPGVRPIDSQEFALSELDWDQFHDGDPGNDFVTVRYNNNDAPSYLGGSDRPAYVSSMARWTDVATSSFVFEDGGDTDKCPSLVDECRGRQKFDGYNDVGWGDIRTSGVLGVTWFGTQTDEFDMWIDNTNFIWYDGASEDTTPAGQYDLQSVETHEFGHALGLNHSSVIDAVMYAYYVVPERDLHSDDINGVSARYPAPVALTYGTVFGTVTDATTLLPISGAAVSTDTGESDTTAADGTYQILDVPTGLRDVTASAAGYGPATTLDVDVVEAADSVANFALTAIPTGSVAGTVTNAGTGSPVSGASVSLDTGESTTTALDGTYTISGVAIGGNTVSVSAAGYASDSQGVTVIDGGTATADFALSEVTVANAVIVSNVTNTFEGGRNSNKHFITTVYLVDNLGNPVSGASVSVELTNDTSGGPWTGTATTGSSGSVSFTLKNAPSGCFSTEVTNVSAGSLSWDGVTPINQGCK